MQIIQTLEATRDETLEHFQLGDRELARCYAAGKWPIRFILHHLADGSSRPEGARAELLVDELRDWGLAIHRVDDVVSPEHGFVITRVVSVAHVAAP